MMPEVYRESEPYMFISYSHDDDALVLPMIKKLHAYGYRVWYDQGIDPGTEWIETIALKIRSCGCFIALLSKNYLASKVCVKELHHALNHERKLLVIYLEDVELSDGLAMQINPVQHICKYTYKKESEFYNKLFSSPPLKVCLNETDKPSQTPKELTETAETPKKTAKPSPAKGAQTETPVKKPTRQRNTTPEQGRQTTASVEKSTNKKKTASQQGKQTATPVNNGSLEYRSQFSVFWHNWCLTGLSLFFAITACVLFFVKPEEYLPYSFASAALAGYFGFYSLDNFYNNSVFSHIVATFGILLAFLPCLYFIKIGSFGIPILFYTPFVLITLDKWLCSYDTHNTASVILLIASIALFAACPILAGDSPTIPTNAWWLLGASLLCTYLSRHFTESTWVLVLDLAMITLFLMLFGFSVLNEELRMTNPLIYLALLSPAVWSSFYRRDC